MFRRNGQSLRGGGDNAPQLTRPVDSAPHLPPALHERSKTDFDHEVNETWKEEVRKARAKRFQDVLSELPEPPARLRVVRTPKHRPDTAQVRDLNERIALARKNRNGTIPGQYIVMFKEEFFPYALRASEEFPAECVSVTGETLTAVSQGIVEGVGARLHGAYSHAFTGFSAKLTQAQVDAIAQHPWVEIVEPEMMLFPEVDQANPANWGLDRIDEDNVSTENVFRYKYDGTGVSMYIIDTGINSGHQNFAGRLGTGYDTASETEVTVYSDNDAVEDTDSLGHGTHVAGIAAGSIHGVARDATIHPVRGLSIASVNWVIAHHPANVPAVINISFGGYGSPIPPVWETAMTNAINDGIVVVTSAGNMNQDVQKDGDLHFPGGIPAVITVGATDSNDSKNSLSNFGDEVDVFAPGGSITSATTGDSTATRQLSGTSMASPHVAGVAAAYLEMNPTASHAEVQQWIISQAHTGKLALGQGAINAGTPNRLLHSYLWWYPLHTLAELQNSDVNSDNYWFQKTELGDPSGGYWLWTNQYYYPYIWRVNSSSGEWLQFVQSDHHWYFWNHSNPSWETVYE